MTRELEAIVPVIDSKFLSPLFSTAGITNSEIPYGGQSPQSRSGTERGNAKPCENPFDCSFTVAEEQSQSDVDSRIEAELQELGGQMAGSILDF